MGPVFEPANRKQFLVTTPDQAESVYKAYNEYLSRTGSGDELGDFHLPERNRRFTRLLIWYGSTDVAGRVGADLFSREEPEKLTPARMASALRDLLLLHHQVIITDQLQDLLEILSHQTDNLPRSQFSAELKEARGAFYRDKYARYIDFLLDIADLIRQEIVIVVSNKAAFSFAPLDREACASFAEGETQPDDEQDYEAHVAEDVVQKMGEGGDVLPPYDVTRRLIPLSELCFHYDAYPFLDNERDAVAYGHIQRSLWEKAERGADQPRDVEADPVFTNPLSLTAEHLTTQDFVDLRLHPDTFDRWRRSFSTALVAKDWGAVKEIAFEGLYEMHKRGREEQSNAIGRPTKNFTFSWAIGELVKSLPPDPSILIASMVTTAAAELNERFAAQRLAENKRRAQDAMVKHYHALFHAHPRE